MSLFRLSQVTRIRADLVLGPNKYPHLIATGAVQSRALLTVFAAIVNR